MSYLENSKKHRKTKQLQTPRVWITPQALEQFNERARRLEHVAKQAEELGRTIAEQQAEITRLRAALEQAGRSKTVGDVRRIVGEVLR